MENKPTYYIGEARKIKDSNWDKAWEFYIKGLRYYLKDKHNHREQIASLYFEMAMRAYSLEVWAKRI